MAAATPFTPYWRALEPPGGPSSWVFFVVAQIAGRHRPVAVVSSVSDEPEESIMGYPLTACCRRIITIFGDPTNHLAIRAELALAVGYYVRDGDHEYLLEPMELPAYNRLISTTRERRRPWDRTSVREFPFIQACLLQGVGFDPQLGRTQRARPEPLATVYRDTSLEWGMVVVDITELDAIRYGIVGFAVGRAKFISSPEAERRPAVPGSMGTGVFERGELKVMEESRPRRAMSAAEYMAKFNREASEYGNAGEAIAEIPLVDAAAMSLVWPPDPEDDNHLPPVGLSVSNRGTSQGSHAFTHNCEHLSLEQVGALSAESISATLGGPGMDKVRSISLCIDSIQSTPAQLIDVLSRVDTLREIYLLQSPTRESDALSVEFFEELASRPHVLSRVNVMLAGAYSAALRQKFWLPTVSKRANAVQLAPLEVFPVQQILVRHQINAYRHIKLDHDYVYLGDGLLKPERFAAGFLLYLSTLQPGPDDTFNSKAQLFSFSSAPASLAADPLSAAQVSPVLAESFALPIWLPRHDARYWPRVRELVPGGWTVIISQEIHRSSGSYYIRYAFIRPRHQPIIIDDPPPEPLSLEGLEIVGLKEFLNITAPEVDPVLIDRRLHDVAEKLASGIQYWSPLPPDVEPLSVLNLEEAAEILPEFLKDAKELNNRLREAMKENPEERDWYPELVVEDPESR
ncbi:hypothetical protein F5Y13DRAFT_47659 [Hypoxylon sp. FL1857]|nr:hypothetical protein F5Y13DRAFT_47659 [Hypoxylon sp. FL1857]